MPTVPPYVHRISLVPLASPRRVVCFAALLVAGCSAARARPPHVPRDEDSSVAEVSEEVTAVPVPLRRLTNEEYNNTVRDLLGDTSHPASAFPPDEVVGGFENNTVAPVTQALVERYMGAAEALAATAIGRLDKLAPCPDGAPREPCARAFVDTFGRLAYRRPLDEGERTTLLAIYSEKEKSSDHARAVKLVLEVILQSPKFLYRLEPAGDQGPKTRLLSGYELATRLSYFVWASTPDTELLDAAAAGQLSTTEDIARTARRMLKDARAVEGIRSFHRQWLDLRKLDTESKDPALYPAYTRELKDAMVEETLRFSAHAVLRGGDSIAALLTSRTSFVNAPLAKLYGLSPPSIPRGGFASVEMPSSERSGLLTHASVLTVHANADQGSPILRGKFVREKLLCQAIPAPPPSVVNTPPRFDPKLTKKQQFAQHQTDPSCASCHRMMDPVGFGFEHYDAVGAWRGTDGAFAVDAVGELSATNGMDGTFDGAIALGERLSTSEQVRHCVRTQWFRSALGRIENDEDTPSLVHAYTAFAHAGYDVRELIVAITTSDAFRHTGREDGTAL